VASGRRGRAAPCRPGPEPDHRDRPEVVGEPPQGGVAAGLERAVEAGPHLHLARGAAHLDQGQRGGDRLGQDQGAGGNGEAPADLLVAGDVEVDGIGAGQVDGGDQRRRRVARGHLALRLLHLQPVVEVGQLVGAELGDDDLEVGRLQVGAEPAEEPLEVGAVVGGAAAVDGVRLALEPEQAARWRRVCWCRARRRSEP